MSAPKRFEPKLDPDRLQDLRKRLDRACKEAEQRPEPVAPWEMDKTRLGMTHARHRHLLFAWRDFLADKPVGHQAPDGGRPGPDHDTWPAFEKRMQTFDHYMADIEDISMHFVWERASTSPHVRRPVIPLLILHGWPSSVADFFNTIHPLAHPGENAPSNVPAFDVVVPSQTGYLWSTSPKVDGFGRGQHSGPQGDLLLSDEARIVHKLMLSLGYSKYAIQAGDWGAALSRHMACMFPRNIVAVHLNFCPAGPPALDPPLLRLPSRLVPSPVKKIAHVLTPTPIATILKSIVDYPIWRPRTDYLREPTSSDWLAHYLLGFPVPLDAEERKRQQKAITFTTTGSAYANMQGSRSSTLGLALQSDPGALLAWVGEKWLEWTDEEYVCPTMRIAVLQLNHLVHDSPSDADLCALLTLYWCTDTMPRSIYNYRNRPPVTGQLPVTDPALNIKQPFGMSDFPFEVCVCVCVLLWRPVRCTLTMRATAAHPISAGLDEAHR